MRSSRFTTLAYRMLTVTSSKEIYRKIRNHVSPPNIQVVRE